MWIAFLIISLALLAGAITAAFIIGLGKYKVGRVMTPLNALLIGAFLSLFFMLLPVYINMPKEYSVTTLKAIFLSLHNTFQTFTLNNDKDVILEHVRITNQSLFSVFSSYLSFMFVVAPILTFGFLMSFFKNIISYVRYSLHFFSEIYVFSELTPKSLALGKDLKKNHKRAAIVYMNVSDNNPVAFDLIESAKEFRSILFKKDILSINFGFHSKFSLLSFFTISEDESSNIITGLKLSEMYPKRNKKYTKLYVFTDLPESDPLLERARTSSMDVRKKNKVVSLIYKTLYEKPELFFGNAETTENGKKKISAVIIGLGQYGVEMLKALSWYLQMDGYEFEINVFDKDKNAAERMAALAPELFKNDPSDASVPDDEKYPIAIHSDVDVKTKAFADEITKVKATYVLVSLGNDEQNISTAMNLRMLFERIDRHPTIQSIVYDSEEKESLSGIKNFKEQEYDIDFIGDIDSTFTESVIVNSVVEEKGRKVNYDGFNGSDDDYWKFEYNYRSSTASAIHLVACRYCKTPGLDVDPDKRTPEQKDAVSRLEHRRWNAFMRSQGYVYGGSIERAVGRNDLGKKHNFLVTFDDLPQDIKDIDNRIKDLRFIK